MLDAGPYRLEGGGVTCAYIAGGDDGLRWMEESEDAGEGARVLGCSAN